MHPVKYKANTSVDNAIQSRELHGFSTGEEGMEITFVVTCGLSGLDGNRFVEAPSRFLPFDNERLDQDECILCNTLMGIEMQLDMVSCETCGEHTTTA